MITNLEDVVQTLKKDTPILMQVLLQPAKQSVQGKPSYICPFCGHGKHGDGMTVIPDGKTGGGLIKCFGAGCAFGSGDVVKLYAQMQGIDYKDSQGFIQAVRELASMDFLVLKEDDSKNNKVTPKIRSAENAMDKLPKPADVSGMYLEQIDTWKKDAWKRTEYFSKRGFTRDTVDRFFLGYNDNQLFFVDGKPTYMPGIIIPYDKSGSYYIARSINGKYFYKPPAKEAGPEPVFNGSALYQEGQPCCICESQTDAISILQTAQSAEIRIGAVALGGAGTGKLEEIIKSSPPVSPLVLCCDNDDKGRILSEKMEAIIKAQKLSCTVAKFSLDEYGGDKKDPNDLLRSNAEQFAADLRTIADEALPKSEIMQFLTKSRTDAYRPVPTGIVSLDKMLCGGFIPQTLICLGAEPAAGKTILATQIFEFMAKNCNREILYFNLEMSRDQLLARAIARNLYLQSGGRYQFSATDILQGYKMSETERTEVDRAAGDYEASVSGRLIYNPEGAGDDVQSILACINDRAKKAVSIGRPAPYVCIDYLQIVQGAPKQDAGEIVKQVVKGLKDYAARYDAIVFCIMAQSRVVNAQGKPTLAAGRDSSAIEYSADLQMQLLREDDSNRDNLRLYITKSRFTTASMTQGVNLRMHGAQSWFEDLDEIKSSDHKGISSLKKEDEKKTVKTRKN